MLLICAESNPSHSFLLFFCQSDLKQIGAGALPDDFAKSKVPKVSCYVF